MTLHLIGKTPQNLTSIEQKIHDLLKGKDVPEEIIHLIISKLVHSSQLR